MLKRTVILIAIAATIGGAPSVSNAITLTDGNSSVLIDPTGTGAIMWNINGANQLGQQWFWFRDGATDPETALGAGALIGSSATPVGANGVNLVYNYNGFDITVNYTLTGGAPGTGGADLAEVITIVNKGLKILDFHFFQFVDFNLGTSPNDDTVQLVSPGRVQQSDPAGIMSEGVVDVAPSRFEIDKAPNTHAKLVDGDADNLNNATSPFGPADATWAFQWDKTLFTDPALGDTSLTIHKLKHFSSVPETPSAALLLGLALTALGLLGRRYGTTD